MIDSDVVENLLKFHHRKDKDQKCVFALLLGTVKGYDNYHIKNCILRFIYYAPDYTKKEEGSNNQLSLFKVKLI